MKAIWVFLLLLPATLFAQTTISGKVTDANNKPVAYASVFLSNTIVGTRSNDDGLFTLQNVKPGQYDLVVSFIGYETHHQTITISNASVNVPPVVLQAKTNQLKEVRIGAPDPNRARWLQLFIHEFLGRTPNADDSKILNPGIVDLNFDKSTRTLSASSDDFIIVENKALGFKIHYQLAHFLIQWQGFNYSTYYDGPAFFEYLKGSPLQVRRWEKNRIETYHGSSMHFLRSLFNNQFEQEGFNVLRLVRKPNPARPTDSLIEANSKKYSLNTSAHLGWRDSLIYWRAKLQLPKMIDFLQKTPLNVADFVATTETKDMLRLQYSDYLYITNHQIQNEKICTNCIVVGHPAVTVVILNTKYAEFDHNGILIDPSNISLDGAWGTYRVADMLPVDYEPTR